MVKSSLFIAMQTRDKNRINNPMFGRKKRALWTKLFYVYDAIPRDSQYILLGIFPTVALACVKQFHMERDTLTKYLKNQQPYKGKIFTRVPFK